MRKFLFALLLAGLVLVGCGETTVPETTENDSVPEAVPTEEVASESASESMEPDPQFEEAVANYNDIYKKALFSTGQGKEEEAQQTTPKSLQMWQDIAAQYSETPPAGYGQTEDWTGTINEILNLEQEAVNLVEEGSYPEAHEQLEQVRKILRTLRQENNITNNISDLMLTFHDEMEIVTEAGSLEEAKPHIENLVQYFQPLEEYSDAPDYQAQAEKLGQIVTQLQNAESEEAFQEAQSKVKPAFIQFYLQHG